MPYSISPPKVIIRPHTALVNQVRNKSMNEGTLMNRRSQPEKVILDFTKVSNPIDAFDLANWSRDRGREITPEIAAQMGLKAFNGKVSRQFKLGPRFVDLRIAPDRILTLEAESLEANLRPDGTLQVLLLRSFPQAAEAIAETAKVIVQTWKLHTFEEIPEEEEEQDPPRPLVKLDAITELEKWSANPPDSLPSFYAQSDKNILPGIWFLRMVINPLIDDSSRFRISTQVFWRDQAFDDQQRQREFL